MVRRIDLVTLDATPKTAEGYIDTPGRLTRTGVFTYRREDGSEQLELRLPEHVFSPESIASFDGQPLTLGHPPASITAESWKQHSVGVILSPQQDGDHIRARVRIMDRDAVRAVEGGIKELSNGYETDLVAVPNGEFRRDDYNDGKPVKAHFIQTNIRGNHTALVSKGRAGPTARLDSAGNAVHEGNTMTLEEMQKKVDALEAMIATLSKPAEPTIVPAENTDELETLRGANKAMSAQLAKAESKAAEQARADLAKRAAPVLKRDAQDIIASKDDEDAIMRAVIATAVPELDTKEWKTKELRGAFEAAMISESKRTDTAAATARAVALARETSAKVDEVPAGSQEAFLAMNRRFAEQWKKSPTELRK